MKYEVLKTALKKMECQRSRSSRKHIRAYPEKTYQKGPSSLQTRITVNHDDPWDICDYLPPATGNVKRSLAQ